MPDVDNTITYTYDGRGNRTKRVVTGLDAGTTVYIYDSNNRLTLETTTNYKGTSITAYEYDKNGNNTAKVCGGERLEYRYDAFGKLKRYITNDDIARYAYNSNGIRTLKSIDGVETKYILNGGDVVGEVSEGVTTTYLRGINLICTDEWYYIFDAHGDVVNLTDDEGSVVKTYVYDAFGVEKNPDEADSNPFRYCGEYWDRETETYYLRARYYDPNLGRFTSEDPARQGTNWYVYCDNNPIKYIDPTGLDAIIITDIDGAFLQGHISGLFQDSDGIWYYYYWGNKEAFVVEITDSSAMDSLDSLNNWLNDNNIYSGKYDHATYIAGDFTESLNHANSLSMNYNTDQYNLLWRNCMQTTWECVRKGKFNDGTSVGDMVKSDIGIRPNSNYKVIGYIFYNTDFTHDDYWKTINDRLWKERENYNNAWTQWSKNVSQKRINWLEKLYY